MKTSLHLMLIGALFLSLTACSDPSQPNYQYFPNMYESVGYGTYAEAPFADGTAAQLPVEGSVPRGWEPYDYPNTNEGYETALKTLKSPLEVSEIDTKRGKELYDIYCGICHGNKGAGQGKLVKREKILGVPSYADRAITTGSIYHVIYYGKNSMGSYANLLNEEERWQVTAYVEALRTEL